MRKNRVRGVCRNPFSLLERTDQRVLCSLLYSLSISFSYPPSQTLWLNSAASLYNLHQEICHLCTKNWQTSCFLSSSYTIHVPWSLKLPHHSFHKYCKFLYISWEWLPTYFCFHSLLVDLKAGHEKSTLKNPYGEARKDDHHITNGIRHELNSLNNLTPALYTC